jgi:uncharacterized protein with GYD domain
MAQFLVEVAYTQQAWAALVNNPQDRSQAVKSAAENLGGKIDHLWLSFGEYDSIVVIDMPDNVSAAALSMAISAGGSCKSVKTIPLLSAQDGLEAMKKASTSGYRAIAQTAKA